MNTPFIVLDIETAPLDGDQLIEPPLKYIGKGTGNLVDPKKIEAKLDANRARWYEKAALDPRLGQIICAVMRTEDDAHATNVRLTGDPERDLLVWIWDTLDDLGRVKATTHHARAREVVGFGILDFDIPFLIARSAMLGVRPSIEFDLRRYSMKHGIVDWLWVLSNWGRWEMEGWSLDTYSKLYALSDGFGESALVPEEWANEHYAYVERHCIADVDRVAELHKRLIDIYRPGGPF